MSGFASPFKFGLPGSELSLNGTLEPFTDQITVQLGRTEAVNENVQGETFARVFRRREVGFNLKIEGATEAQKNAIESLWLIGHSFLSLIYAGDQALYSERYIMETATTFKMLSTPHLRLDKALNLVGASAAFAVTGVFDNYDGLGAQVTPNRFFSFNRADWTVAINVPKTPSDAVFVNSTYKGALVRIDSLSTRQYAFDDFGGISYEISIGVKGV
jgi:hypothetical protein